MCDRKDNYENQEDSHRGGPPWHREGGRPSFGRRIPWPLKILGAVVIIPGFLFLGTWIGMLIWNAFMPVVFGLPILGFWHMMGMLALGRLIFGGHHGGRGQGGFPRRPPFKDRDSWKSHLRERFAEERGRAEDAPETGSPDPS